MDIEMPHIILECSDNIIESDLKPICADIQNILVDKLPTQLESCKSRIIRHKDYVLGDGNSDNAFVHLCVSIMPGREQLLINMISEFLLERMKDFFHLSLNHLNLQISIRMNELPISYRKFKKD
jgi:5-carboxymethyl-2-hydroxymuconate isomerase